MKSSLIKKSYLRGKEYFLFESKSEMYFYVGINFDLDNHDSDAGERWLPSLKNVRLLLNLYGKIYYDREIVPSRLEVAVPDKKYLGISYQIKKYYQEIYPKCEITLEVLK
jgi:hypothetical protein